MLLLRSSCRVSGVSDPYSYPESRAFAELLIDCEEDRRLRAVLVGMLREAALAASGRQSVRLLR